jgi:hypothetical protein
MKILGVEQAKAEAVSHSGSHWGLWDVRYEIVEPGKFVKSCRHLSLDVAAIRTFRISCGLTSAGKFFLSCKTKDRDRVVEALRKSPLFLRIRMDIASSMLLSLVQELGDDAVRQAFEEAIVKSVAEA